MKKINPELQKRLNKLFNKQISGMRNLQTSIYLAVLDAYETATELDEDLLQPIKTSAQEVIEKARRVK